MCIILFYIAQIPRGFANVVRNLNMSTEDKVIEALNTLNNRQKIQFGIFCVGRVIDLYKKVDEAVYLILINDSIKKEDPFKQLDFIFNKIKEESVTDENIDELVDRCNSLILDTELIFDNITVNEVSSLVAQGVDYILRFIQNSQGDCIEYCSANNIEILNQLKPEEYYIKCSSKVNDDEIMGYVETFLGKEYELQIEALNLIKKEDYQSLSDLKDKSIIEWF